MTIKTDLPDDFLGGEPFLGEDIVEARRLKRLAIQRMRKRDSVERKLIEELAAEILDDLLARLSKRSRNAVHKLATPTVSVPVMASRKAPTLTIAEERPRVSTKAQRIAQQKAWAEAGLCVKCGELPGTNPPLGVCDGCKFPRR